MCISYNIRSMKEQLILGFDFGAKYIGVAIGQTATNHARPLTCIKVKNWRINWSTIDQLIKDWEPRQLIVGIPVDMDGKEQHTTLECLKFFNSLQKRYNLPIHKVDERLSTWEAKKRSCLLKSNYNAKELLEINANAAAIILQQWLNSINNTNL